MGLEAECRVRFGGKSSRGKARLEEKEVLFRGDFRLAIPLAEVRSVEAKAGTLSLRSAAGLARFELGPAAEKWAARIRAPRGRLDKLGVKAGSRIRLVGLDDDGFGRELEARGAKVVDRATGGGLDIVFARVTRGAELAELAALRGAIAPAGAVWVLWPKGKKELREDDVRAAALASGLVDVKVVSFSEELSALKLVIPLRDR